MGIVEDYFDDIPKAILNFQLLEEALRNYLARCEAFTLIRTRGIIDFQLNMKPIDKASLGKLVDLFEKRNKNLELIARLKKIIPDRNFFAHEAYTSILMKGKCNEEQSEENHKRLQQVIKDSNDCFLSVWEQTSALEKRMKQSENIRVENKQRDVD